MRSIPMRAMMACAAFLAVGCGGTPDPIDAGPMTDDAGPMMTDSGVDGAMPPGGDGNDSFANAEMLDISGDPAVTMARIGTPGDRDYYRFDGTAGQWLLLSTDANPDDDPMMIDTVITLYDASMTMIAENDDAQPRARTTDSEIIARLPTDGTYYVMVQEWSQWADDMPFEGQADYGYELTVARLDLDADAVTLDGEGGDDLASAQALGYNVSTDDFGILVGDFRDNSDVDVFSFTVDASKPNIRMMMMPSGAAGYGSSTAVGNMWITNADGTETIARIAISESTDPMVASMVNIQPNLPPGDYNFFVENGGTPGSNGFYVLKVWRFATDNDPETDDAANNDPTMAQALALAPHPTIADLRRGFVLSRLPAGDIDHFSVSVMGTEQVSLFCGSRTRGSGVLDLTVELMDSAGSTVLATATETATTGAFVEDFAVSAPGTYIIRLSKGSQDTEVTGDWVRCVALLAPPRPAP